MNAFNRLTHVTFVALCIASFIGNAQVASAAGYGDIVFYNSKNEKTCSLAVPETRQTYDFSSSSQSCENNSAASFQLENIPSATLIQFYENESCSDAKSENNFFVKVKTVKQPTDWTAPPSQMNFNDFKKKEAGYLVPRKNIRIEEQWEGSDYSQRDWDERISCVYIERSQPVN